MRCSSLKKVSRLPFAAHATPGMSVRLLPFSFAALFALAVLVGCRDDPAARPTQQDVRSMRQAIRQNYEAENVKVSMRQDDSARELEVVLVNPSGREATNRQQAYSVAQTAQSRYGSSTLDTVMVSFEFSSTSGPAEVGYHRRYFFTPSDLSGPADTTATDTTRSKVDTSATSQP